MLVELSTVKGTAVWVNPRQVLYVGPPEGGGSSMYGANNVRAGAKIFFAHGVSLEVSETAQEAAVRLGADREARPSSID